MLLLEQGDARAQESAKGLVDEIAVHDLDESIVLRADGAAEFRYRGRPNDFVSDERVGFYTAQIDPRHFKRLAAILRDGDRDIDLAKLEDFYLPYSQRIVRLSLKRGDFSKTIAINERNVKGDPEPPDRLWTLEMAARGLASQQSWKPIGTGLKVRFKEVSKELREIVVRDEEHFPIVMMTSHKQLVELPLKPGKYVVETGLLKDRPLVDLRKTKATVAEEGYLEVAVGE
jgi:hypothetical protein